MSHYRSLSPGSSRYHSGGPRASTGMVQLSSDHYDHRSRYDYDGYPSDAGYTSARYPSRRSPVEARPVGTHKIPSSSSGTTKRTEYAIQPQSRHRSNTTSSMDYNNLPRISVPSSHIRPVITSGPGITSSPVSADSGQYLVPYSPHGHRRVYSTDYASDSGRNGAYGGSKHYSSRHAPSYRVYPENSRRHYSGIRKGDDIDSYDAYSYTTPREQFDRDYPVKARPSSRSSHSRPLSMTVMDGEPRILRPISRNRHHGPPPTSWGLDKMDTIERPRSARPEDQHRSGSKSRGHDRALVLSRGSEDDYDSHSDGRRRRRRHRRSHHDDDGHHREHREHRSRRSHNSDSDRALVGLGAAGLGTAALGAGYPESDYDYSGRRHHRYPRDDDRGYDSSAPASRELLDDGSERSKHLYLEGGDHPNRRSRSRQQSRRHNGSSEGFTDDEDLREYKRQPSADPRRRRHSSEDTSEDERPASRHRDRSHRRSSHRLLDDRSYHSGSSRHSPSHDSKDDLKNPITVDPAPKAPEVVPKGILKAPRASFPEEKNPVREGVAPLKDASKKGIPPGARWTKIDRRLVNPEALDKGNERYEERSDYVIVLRVLSKEEIQAYAVKTQEIRDTRHKDQTRDRRRRIEASQKDGSREKSSSDDEDERGDKHHQKEQPQQPQLEAPPAPHSDQLSLPFHSRAEAPVQGTEGLRPAPSMAQV